MARKSKKRWINTIRQRFRIVIQTEHDFLEKHQFQASPLRFFSLLSLIILFFVLLTVYIIAFTRLRVYIPGYTDPSLREELYVLEHKSDSLERALDNMTLFNANIRHILMGEDTLSYEHEKYATNIQNLSLEYSISSSDSAFRANFERESMYNIFGNYSIDNSIIKPVNIKSFTFYPPIKGKISSDYDIANGHVGVDVIPIGSELVKSVLNGMVIFSGWTVETGNVIVLSHLNNIISIYKHNSVLLKKEGDYVVAGEAIASCGNSGDLTIGTHLHFELWFENRPVNPSEFIDFE